MNTHTHHSWRSHRSITHDHPDWLPHSPGLVLWCVAMTLLPVAAAVYGAVSFWLS